MHATMGIQTKEILSLLHRLGDRDIANHSQRFFKTGKGEYGEGDRFLGIRVPILRQFARKYGKIPLADALALLASPFHEARLLALLILVGKYAETGTSADGRKIYRAYLDHTGYINNWDLVDCSAAHIVGAHLFRRNRKPIYRLAGSKNLWERRISILSTFFFIKRNEFSDALAVAESLLKDPEDLIHKAAGWMLREVGKKRPAVEKGFLAKHYRRMPRTMLRYAIEKFPEAERQAYLRGSK